MKEEARQARRGCWAMGKGKEGENGGLVGLDE